MIESTEIQTTSLAPTLGSLTFARLILNGARRFPYLILTPMAAALGVPRSTLEVALSAQYVVALFGPLAGPTMDRSGRKRIMLLSMFLLSISAGLAALGQTLGVVFLAIMMGSIAKTLYDPSMQAYIGDRVPYARRGFALGITELAWSGSLITFGPLSAYLITNVGLGAIYAVIAVGAAAAGVALWWVLPSDHIIGGNIASTLNLRNGFGLILATRPALVLLLSQVLVSIAADLTGIVYESWMRDALNLTTVAIGGLAILFSIAEFSGEGVIVVFSDRIGKRRLAISMVATTGVIYLMLPFSSFSVPFAVLMLFLLFFTFEIGVIAVIPLATEALPEARGVMMTSNGAAMAIGRATGTLLGGWLFRSVGFGANGLIAAMLNFSAAFLLWRFLAAERGVRQRLRGTT